MVRRRQCSSERNRESKPAPDRGREGIHGGREREEESLRVQDAGNGCAEVRLTFLPLPYAVPPPPNREKIVKVHSAAEPMAETELGVRRVTVLLLYVALFALGVPVWWRTTEVYRAAIPFHLLDAAGGEGLPRLAVRLVLAQELGGDGSDAAGWLETQLNRHIDPVRDGIRVKVVGETLQSPLPDDVHDDWQMNAWLEEMQGGSKCSRAETCSSELHIFLLPSGRKGAFRVQDGGSRLTMGTGIVGWLLVSPDPSRLTMSMQGLPKMLAAVVRGETDASSALVEATSAGARASAASARFGGELKARDVGVPTPLRVSLTLLVGCSSDSPDEGGGPDCGSGAVTWEAEQAIESGLQPLVRSLLGIYNISVDSHILHFADLAVPPVLDEAHQAYVLKSSTLNDFINWRDWPLDSTTSLIRTIHLLLYLPSRHVSPLILLDRNAEPLSPAAFTVAGYGAVHVMNDTSILSSSAAGAGTFITKESLRIPLGSLVGQLRNFLGLKTPPGVSSLPDYSTGAPLWQLLMMQRRNTRARMASARSTLKIFEGLIASIPNMLIRDEISLHVQEAIEYVLRAETDWAAARFTEASHWAAQSFDAAEKVFFEESILSRLYFPDDHKFAVYVPYFVPVMLPLLVGLVREGKAYHMKRREKMKAD